MDNQGGNYYYPGYNGYPPYYNNNNSINPMLEAERNAVKWIKYNSRVAGLAVLSYVFLMVFATGALWDLLGVSGTGNEAVEGCISILSSFICILLPFALCGLTLEKKKSIKVFYFNKPSSTALMLLAVPMGLAFCLVGNYVTNFLVTYLESAGVYLTSDDYTVPSDLFGRVICILQVAVVPPLCEELAIRGTVMQPLRKYGDSFAIIASSLVFAIMHGNLVQAPFAFIAGLVMGYSVCITGSIWTSVLIHFANNLFSVIVSFLVADIADEARLNLIYTGAVFAIYGIGLFAALLFFLLKRNKKLRPRPVYISGRRAATSYAATLPMLLALLAMVWITSFYVNFGG